MKLRTSSSMRSCMRLPTSCDGIAFGFNTRVLYELAMPELRRQYPHERHIFAEADELLITALICELLDGFCVEIAGRGDVGCGKPPANVVGRVHTHEAAAIGRAIRLLASARYARGQKLCHALAKNVFLAQRAKLQFRRNPGSELDDAVVKEGEATLDGVRHGDAIALRGQNIA